MITGIVLGLLCGGIWPLYIGFILYHKRSIKIKESDQKKTKEYFRVRYK